MPEKSQRQMNQHAVVDASIDPKGDDLREARNHGRREMWRNHVPNRSRGAKRGEDAGNEHKEKPFGASTHRKAEIAEVYARLQTAELERKNNEHGRSEARTSLS